MGNKSYNQHHHLNQKNANTCSPLPPSSTTLLPLLCRVSIKDTLNQLSTTTTTTTTTRSKCPLKEDPNSSPKISCMGHVKRRHSTTTAKVSYKQLKKIFSNKNLLLTTTTTATANSVSRTKSKRRSSDHVVVPLNLAALDPPLPVVKKVVQLPCGGEEGVSLWERRSGGAGLRGLQCPLAPKRTSQFFQPITV